MPLNLRTAIVAALGFVVAFAVVAGPECPGVFGRVGQLPELNAPGPPRVKRTDDFCNCSCQASGASKP